MNGQSEKFLLSFSICTYYLLCHFCLVLLQMELDDSVGQIMSALKDSGADEDTFVFFTADNG